MYKNLLDVNRENRLQTAGDILYPSTMTWLYIIIVRKIFGYPYLAFSGNSSLLVQLTDQMGRWQCFCGIS